MSIRPIDFNGMLQQTHDVTVQKTNEDNQPAQMQQHVTVQQEKNEQTQAQTVQQRSDAGEESYRLDANGGGNGRGREGKKKKDEDKEEKKKFSEDGSFSVKGGHPGGFNITI